MQEEGSTSSNIFTTSSEVIYEEKTLYSMSVKELKKTLTSFGINPDSFIEKKEMINALVSSGKVTTKQSIEQEEISSSTSTYIGTSTSSTATATTLDGGESLETSSSSSFSISTSSDTTTAGFYS